jgi:GNAT superfamily N-acetyltransferase
MVRGPGGGAPEGGRGGAQVTYTRRAVEADLDALLPLCAAFHAESPVHRDLAFDARKVAELIAMATASADWLAEVACDDDGAIVGMLLLYCMEPFYSRELTVGDLTFWVDPQARGGRAAMLLMKDALAWAAMKGASVVQLGITTGINEDAAARFFSKYGFEQKGILMQRSAPPKPF